MSSSSPLSFTISVPRDAHDILALMTFCRKHGYPFPKGYDVTRVGSIYLAAIVGDSAVPTITPRQFMDAHGADKEILEHILFLQEEVVAHWQSEFDCWDPDHPEVVRIEVEWQKSREGLQKVKAFCAAVLETCDD